MSTEQTIQCASACTVTVVHELSLPVLNLTAEQGAALAGATIALWAVGYVFRVIARSISTGGESTEEREG